MSGTVQVRTVRDGEDQTADLEPSRVRALGPCGADADRATAYAPDPSLTLDDRGVVRAANGLACDLLGRALDDVVGHPVTTFLAEGEGVLDVLLEERPGTPATAGGCGALLSLRRPDGTRRRVAVTARAVGAGADRRTVVAFRDGTTLERTNAAVAGRDRILTAVADAVDRMLRSDHLEETIDEVLRTLGEATAVSRVYVFEVTETVDDHIARQRWEWCAPGVEPQIDNEDLQAMPLRASGFQRWETVLRGRGVLHGDVQDFPADEAEILGAQDIRSIVVAPLHVEGDWWGFLGFDECSVERRWSGPEVDALRAAADVLAVTMRHQSHRRALEVSERAYAEAYEREREAAARLRQLDTLKDTFVEAVSHELRTPLSGIVGFTETLERMELLGADPRAGAILGRLRSNAGRLERLVTDLLDLSALTRGAARAHRVVVSAPELVERATRDVGALLDGRALRVEVAVDEVSVDPDGVSRIVENLLRNACRFAPAGPPIDLRLWTEGDRLEIAVADRGPGIPDDLKVRVFEPFHHGPNAPKHSPGTGVGLAVVTRFAMLHGGEAWVEDRPGGGAVARVSLAEAVSDPS